ncbi:mCG148063 [Mus musculus]|nr:mCG148063 [Mus musculus]
MHEDSRQNPRTHIVARYGSMCGPETGGKEICESHSPPCLNKVSSRFSGTCS